MREFSFPDGRAWVLVRPLPGDKTQILLLVTEKGKAAPLFTDVDLARTYIEASSDRGFVAMALERAEQVNYFTTTREKLSVSLVALDPKYGREAEFVARIEEVIEFVRKQRPSEKPDEQQSAFQDSGTGRGTHPSP
jgi:hypothetical protein